MFNFRIYPAFVFKSLILISKILARKEVLRVAIIERKD